MALSFLLGNAISVIYSAGEQLFAMNIYVVLLAGVAVCFLPPALEKRLVGWFTRAPINQDSDRVIAHLRTDAERKVRALGLLFEEMSQGYETMSPLPDEQAMVVRMRERLCEGCSNYKHCWGGSSARAGRLLVELLGDAMCGRVIAGEVSELPPDLCRRCRRAQQIPRRLKPMLSEYDMQRRASKERGECKALLSSQFRHASEMLLSEGDRLARPMRIDAQTAERAFAALDREGLQAEGVWAVEDDLPQLFIGLKGRYWSRTAASRAARGLSDALGTQMRPTSVGDAMRDDELCFVPAPLMGVDIGFAGRAGQPGGLSGDSHMSGSLLDGRVLMALSDGMGSGSRAASESTAALRLLKRFLGAGVPCTMALDAINELLLLRSGDEMFTTADLCILDLHQGYAQFSKLGGCASLILRGNRIIHIKGGRLPMGVLNKVEPVESMMRLEVGDLIVMVTDGIVDGSRDQEVEWLEAMLRRYQNEHPQKLCERLVNLAAGRQNNRDDDMTAMVAKIHAA